MKRYGLVGKTLKHSFSATYFAKKFSDAGITDCVYQNFELNTIDEFPSLLQEHPDLQGLNVTMPYKEQVLPFLHQQSTEVEAIGACNCIRIDEGKLFGFNTDARAFADSLRPFLKPFHQCALILGAGGASRAVQHALKQLNIDFIIVSRRKQENQPGYEDVSPEMISGHQIIINTTPLGMFPNIDEDPPIPYNCITKDHILYDLIYNPPTTKF